MSQKILNSTDSLLPPGMPVVDTESRIYSCLSRRLRRFENSFPWSSQFILSYVDKIIANFQEQLKSDSLQKDQIKSDKYNFFINNLIQYKNHYQNLSYPYQNLFAYIFFSISLSYNRSLNPNNGLLIPDKGQRIMDQYNTNPINLYTTYNIIETLSNYCLTHKCTPQLREVYKYTIELFFLFFLHYFKIMLIFFLILLIYIIYMYK